MAIKKDDDYLKKVLFVCMGNICRSPAAEGILKKYINEKHLENKIFVDSAGTIDYHVGEKPNPRMLKAASERGFNLTHICRQFNPIFDFKHFDYIFYMDKQNFNEIAYYDIKKEYSHKILSTAGFCTRHNVSIVPDPYYGTMDDYHNVVEILEDACQGILERLIKEIEPDD